MKRLSVLVFILFVILTQGCKKDSNGTNNDPVNPFPEEETINTSVFAYVYDDQNIKLFTQQADDVSLQMLSLTGVGTLLNPPTSYYYSARNLSLNRYGTICYLDGEALATWGSNTNLFMHKLVVSSGSVANYYKFNLIRKKFNDLAVNSGGGTSLSNSTGGTLSCGNGATITFPPNSIKYKDGTSIGGIDDLYIVALNPATEGFMSKVPGYSIGFDADSNKWFLKSYAAALIQSEAFSDFYIHGDATLVPGKYATLKIPIGVPNAPDSITTWQSNEVTTLWIKDGTAKKEGNFYSAEIYNLDDINFAVPVKGAYVSLHLKTETGTPIINAHLIVKASGYEIADGQTDSDGNLLCFVPAGEALTVEIIENNWNNYTGITNILDTKPIGPVSANAQIDISISNSSTGLHIIRGNANYCNGSQINNGVVVINERGRQLTHVLPVVNGKYNSAVFMGPGDLRQIYINCADDINDDGSDTVVMVQRNVENIFNLTACPINTNLYLNYSIDGVSKTPLAGDTSDPYSPMLIGSTNTLETQIFCESGLNGIEFKTSITEVGTFTGASLENFNVDGGYYYVDFTKPYTIKFTRHDLDYIEGSLDLYYRDNAGVSHHLIANFKVKVV